MADLEKIKSLQEEVKMMRADLKKYYNYFKQDGSIDKEEFIYLSSMSKLIQRVEEKIKSYLTDSTTPAQESNGSSTDVKEDNSTQNTGRKGKVTASRLNVRKGPSTDFDKVDKLSNGDIVDILEEKDGWFRIGTDKWVSGDYIEEMNTASQNQEELPQENEQNSNEEGAAQNEETAINVAPNAVIKKSVGKGGDNDPADVLTVQKLLKETWGFDEVPQTGKVEDLTIQAIGQFQYRYAGQINKQDSKIDAAGTTWKYLIGELKPTLSKQEDGTLAGAETETEKKLAEFAEKVGDIQIEVAPGKFIGVRPPYHQNNSRQAVVEAERRKNSAVNKIISKMGWNDSHGKATPGAIKKFLEDCIAKNLINDKSATGLNDFLDRYGISLDCSGLAVQAVNFLIEGDLERDSDEPLRITNARNIMNYGTKITAPKDLVAGDMMVNSGHVRVIIDVDMNGEEVAFTTLESGASKSLGYGGGTGKDGGDGVGNRRYRFPKKDKFENCEVLMGNKWQKGGGDYVYRKLDQKAIDKIQSL